MLIKNKKNNKRLVSEENSRYSLDDRNNSMQTEANLLYFYSINIKTFLTTIKSQPISCLYVKIYVSDE